MILLFVIFLFCRTSVEKAVGRGFLPKITFLVTSGGAYSVRDVSLGGHIIILVRFAMDQRRRLSIDAPIAGNGSAEITLTSEFLFLYIECVKFLLKVVLWLCLNCLS